MLDLFAIFSKSGIVLFATVNPTIASFTEAINRVIQNVILEDRVDKYQYDTMLLQFMLDNEFDLVFVVGYQKMLSLSYVDKFLDDVHLAFREKYKEFDLQEFLQSSANKSVTNKKQFEDENLFFSPLNVIDFRSEFGRIYKTCNRIQQQVGSRPAVAQMKTFEQSQKSKKTVGSMIIKPNDGKGKPAAEPDNFNQEEALKKLAAKQQKATSPKPGKKGAAAPVAQEPKKKVKKATVWDTKAHATYDASLDFSDKASAGEQVNTVSSSVMKNSAMPEDGDMRPDLEFEVEESDEEDDYDARGAAQSAKKNQSSGLFSSMLSSFNYNKTLARSDLEPILDNLRDHLIRKNVATEIARKLCDSVASKLEGQSVNTWMGLKGFVKNALEESILRILSPNRSLNILREVQVKNDAGKPYVIVFCGVNGVGKSTNLAKIANWLIVNGLRVQVIACDTFRAGAIEQLRTHIHALKSIHDADGMIELYEKGYGKDSTGIAMEGIRHAGNNGFNVCLVDTAGRMQGNEPLMKELAKLIKVNEPDLTLFVGEALVGNEAVDQLVNFNKALLDNGCRSASNGSVSAINGIVLTKFDTIDDQVGAAISMTYITGQPIVFVGVGQTYRDLKQLNARAVVKALMK